MRLEFLVVCTSASSFLIKSLQYVYLSCDEDTRHPLSKKYER